MKKINLYKSRIWFQNQFAWNSQIVTWATIITITCFVATFAILVLEWYFTNELKSSNQQIAKLVKFETNSRDLENKYGLLINQVNSIKKYFENEPNWDMRLADVISLGRDGEVKKVTIEQGGEFDLRIQLKSKDGIDTTLENLEKRELNKNKYSKLKLTEGRIASQSATGELSINGLLLTGK